MNMTCGTNHAVGKKSVKYLYCQLMQWKVQQRAMAFLN